MDRLLFTPVNDAAGRDEGHPAVRCAGAQLSYGELAEQSSQLAATLEALGVRRGDRVGIHADKGLASAVAIYGIMKAGAAYVPIDPKAPIDRQAFVLNDCSIRHLVSEPQRAGALRSLLEKPTPVESVVGVAGDEGSIRMIPWEEVEAHPNRSFQANLTSDDLCYVLYTSGSTGTPKGVVHTHRSASAFAQVARDTYGFHHEDRLSNHAPLHFDLSTMDYFSAAIAGATTVVVPEIYTKIPASLAQLIEQERLTVLYMVPLALTHLLLHGALDRRDLSSVRWVLFGGEPFPPRHLRALMEALPEARFSNVYGPTEVNGVTYWMVPPQPPGEDAPIPIGVPYENVEPLVLGDDDRPTRVGEAGELLVRTPTMMRGYWNRPDLDERSFRRVGEATYYRTGDLVRERPDGLLDFLGRIDRQIKARGYRIELDEVEVALMSVPGVAVAAAFGVPEPQGSMRVEAAITAEVGHSPTSDDIRTHLARILPPYMLPEEVQVLEAMPRTSSGKIDRVTLSAQATNRNQAES